METAVPKVVSVEIVPARPTDPDSAMIAQLAAETKRPLPQTAFIVKIRLDRIPPATGHGWALYVGDTRIPKYWEYPDGIYFKVLDEEFLAEHQGEKLRFSENETEFVDTGVKLPAARARGAERVTDVRRLPLQSEVLSQPVPARTARARAVRRRARPARNKRGSKARGRKRGRSR
jgi:hypothetical protein